ncbi:MAG: preprotein translocase subunit SecG [Pseudomonadota bacterium]
MGTLFNLLSVAHAAVSIALIALILMQRGKGADAGASFGAGASGTVFGARGSANFLSRATAILATLFFANCLALAWLATQRGAPSSSVADDIVTEAPAPAAEFDLLPTGPDASDALDSAADGVPEFDGLEDGIESVDEIADDAEAIVEDAVGSVDELDDNTSVDEGE